MTDGPALSIVLAGQNLEETRQVRRSIQRQSSRSSLELVLILPPESPVESPDLFHGLWGGQVLRQELTSRGAANALGVRAARAPIVVLAEDHCYPAADWVDALLADHRGPWTAVGPQVRNANPSSSTSWADFIIGYGPWSRTESAGEAEFLPGHNSSYKRDVLLAYGEDLEQMLESETVLHWDLCRKGHRLLLSRHALVHHLNFSQPAAFRRAQFLNGRNFAAVRSAPWNWGRRMTYAAASPLIPWVRAWRLRRGFGGEQGAPWSCIPTFLLGLYFDAAGQALGYLSRSPGETEELTHLEFCRTRFVLPQDRAVLESSAERAQ
jgi:hypothetical protein